MKIITHIAVAVAAACLFLQASAQAQTCVDGDAYWVAAGIRAKYPVGWTRKISALKTFKIVSYEEYETTAACEFSYKVNIVVTRKLRPNTSGHFMLRGDITRDGHPYCLVNIRATDTTMSNLAGPGENTYQNKINDFIDNENCSRRRMVEGAEDPAAALIEREFGTNNLRGAGVDNKVKVSNEVSDADAFEEDREDFLD